MEIKDGTGTGYRLKVNSQNRAFVKAVSDLTIAVKSFSDGDAYQLFVPSRTLGGAGEHNILYFKNTSETRSFAINKYFIGFGPNSGSLNIVNVKQYLGPTAPTANNTVSGAGNLNTGSGNAATLTVEYWDEVGTAGMTISSRGTQAGEVLCPIGNTVFDVQGSTVIGPGDSLLITATAATSDEVAFTIEGYFLSPDEK